MNSTPYTSSLLTGRRLMGLWALALITVAMPIVGKSQSRTSIGVGAEPLTVRSATETHHLLSFQTGIGVLSLLNDDGVNASITIDSVRREFRSRANGSLAFTLAYDYRVTPLISLGGAIGRQENRLDDFRSASGELLEGASLHANRTLISGRVLFHYGRAANFEMYSGLRIGMTAWSFKLRGLTISQLEDFDIPIPSVGGALPHAQLIPFGCRGEIVPGLSIGGEIALGSPHFVAAQIGYRF